MVDSIDERLLSALMSNSRLSYAELGRQIGLSPSAVRERVQRLESLGIITKYSLEVDKSQLGFGIEAFILLDVFPGKLKYVMDNVKKYTEVMEAHRITGDQNLHLRVLVRSRTALQNLLDRLMDYADTTTFMILSKL
ncbi:Lrp/AsnC family transcriptional regulator [Roseivirga sp.]|uniref:Lrp/AsnC family transcriptional regulator n=1 Tax=Roseivirga sp. TaxID=1964215 RepID=UPI003B520D99